MDFGLSDAQILLRSSLREMLGREAPIERVRKVMETDDGVDRAIHRALGDQGIAGLLVPEEHGGIGLGLLDAAVAAQELGRGAVPVSFHSAYVMAPLLVAAAGTEAQRREWLPRIAEGSAVVAVAIDEALRDDVATGRTSRGGAVSGARRRTARGRGAASGGAGGGGASGGRATGGGAAGGIELGGGGLRGSIGYVPDARGADAILVEVSGSLVLLPVDAPGLTIETLRTVDDTRRVAELVFDGVPRSSVERLPGATTGGGIARALQAGRVALAADALGAAQEGLRIAVDYAKQREQFGQVIGSFQAVKHMCAETAAAIDPIQSLLWYTAYAWDRGLDEARHLVPLLKGHATETATEAVTTCTQVFGGIGFTWECDMHLYFKRAGYDRQMLGGPTEMFALAAAIEHPLGTKRFASS
jgi:alkylation response protein AidB-like acyl-CoA dehydrogenase